MKAIWQFGVARQAVILLLLALSQSARAQGPLPPARSWDISVWIAGATGEETTNSFAQAQTWSAGVSLGKLITGELGKGWRRGTLEYGFDLIPVFVQSRPQTIHGGGVEPVILRWDSSRHIHRLVPYIELAGGAVITTSNLPPGSRTSSFNFTARGGGGVLLFTQNRRSWDISCRWAHVSNANLANFNPEFNGVQVSLGYHWYK